jgi:hypothetical protein
MLSIHLSGKQTKASIISSRHSIEQNLAPTEGVTDGAPCKDIDDGESSGVVGVENERSFLGTDITSLEMGLSVLGGLASLCEGSAVEGEEDEASEGERGHGCACT